MSAVCKPVPNDTEKALVLRSSAASFRSQPPLPARARLHPGVDVLESLEHHWMLAILVFVAIASLGSFWILKAMSPVYQAETTLYVPPDLAKDTGEVTSEGSYPTFVNQQVMSILQYDTLSRALQQLSKKGIAWRGKGETERQGVERLRDSLLVQRVPDSYELMIQTSSGNPRTAATIANTVAQAFLDGGSQPDAAGRGAALLEEKASLEQELAAQLDLKAKLAQTLQVVDMRKSREYPDDEGVIELRHALAEAQGKRIEAEEKLRAGERTAAADAEQLANADPAVSTVRTSLMQRQIELRERIKNMLPSHPVRREAEAELAAIETELEKGQDGEIPRLTAQLIAKLRAQADQYRRMEGDLRRKLSQAAAGIPGMAKSVGQAELVNGEILRIEESLNRLQGELEEIRLRNNSGGTIRVFSPAQPATAPAAARQKKALALIFALGLLLALGIPVTLDAIDSRIYDPAKVEQILGFPIVGMTIDRATATEEFADEHLCRLVAGLERGIAEGARTVLLVGLKQPVPASLMHDITGMLSDHDIHVIVGSGQWRYESRFRARNSTKLIGPSVPLGVAAGVPEGASVPGGVSMTGGLEQPCVQIMDAPALVFSSDAERLALQADMTLLVVRAGKNTWSDLIRGARLLERLNVAAVGVILDDVRIGRAGRLLKRDFKEYLTLERDPEVLARRWEANP